MGIQKTDFLYKLTVEELETRFLRSILLASPKFPELIVELITSCQSGVLLFLQYAVNNANNY